MARHYDGTNDGIVLTPESDFDFLITDTFSLFWWVRTAISAGAFDWQVCKSNSNENPSWYTDYASNESIEFVIRVGAFHVVLATTTINDGNWHCIACTFSGNSNKNGMTVDIDGTRLAGTSASMSGSLANNVDMRYANSTSAGLDFEGDHFHVAIFDIELTQQQITSMRNGVPPMIAAPDANLVSFTPLWGNDSPEQEYTGGVTATVTGTTKTDNPATELLENYL